MKRLHDLLVDSTPKEDPKLSKDEQRLKDLELFSRVLDRPMKLAKRLGNQTNFRDRK